MAIINIFVLQLKEPILKKKINFVGLLATLLLLMNNDTTGQSQPAKKETKFWYEKISLRGYMQVRYNRLFETNPQLKCEQCDKSWGDKGGLFIRRGRLVFSGKVTDRVFFYIQPDFASSSGTTQNLLQLKDAYVDLGFDQNNEFRVRIGQSKVPYGFENMQSSQNRLPLDRADGLNSGLANERDLGAFFYWAPSSTRKLFADFVRENLKGSGDYGVFGFGVYNGQTANKAELNNSMHVVSRLSIPIKIGNQYIEPGIQAYAGKYVLPSDIRSNNVKAISSFEFNDRRVAGSFILYPKPFGIQTEYNVGQGPRYNPSLDSIEVRSLSGGYATFSYKIAGKKKDETFFPFTRIQMYNGGKKHELDARSYHVREIETGMEWQLNKNFEFTASYVFSHRRFLDQKLKTNDQKGQLLRLQAQINF